MIKRLLFISAIFLSTYTLAQETELQQRAESLASGEVFCNASVGIKAITGKGETIADFNGNKLLIPASNMKLISTGTALVGLGKDFRYSTEIAHDGIIQDGVLKGNLYIIGNGDPLTGSKDSIATPIEKLFAQWEACMREAGITSIEGHVVGDGRWLDGMPEEPSWLWNDIGTYYGTGLAGLNFHENMISFNVSVQTTQLDTSVKIEQQYPSTSWMTIRENCKVGEKGTGDQLYMYTSELAPIAEIRGTYGIDRGRKTVDFSNKFPEYTCAVYFKNYLEAKGITCTSGAVDFRLQNHWQPFLETSYGTSQTGDSLKVIGSTFSPALNRIAFKTNHESNNLLAEALFRTLGKATCGDSSYEPSQAACGEVLKELVGDSYKQVRIQDGSGLSRQNLISADFMCHFLQAMMDSECFEEFLHSLPIPGGKGTLSYNMSGYSKELRSRFRVKSGSMSGVRCYSGYILPADYTFVPGEEIPQEVKERTVVFSIMTNNCTAASWKVRPALDKFMAELAGF